MARIFVGMPVAGGYTPSMVSSLLELVRTNPGGHAYVFHPVVNESLISRSRSRLATEFLASECDYLLSIDSDIQFPVDALERLLSHDKDIVAAPYAAKIVPSKWAVALGDDIPDYVQGLMPVRYVPAGFTLVKRKVFETLATPELQYFEEASDTPYYAFYLPMLHQSKGRQVFLSEDFAFCQRAKDAGFELWCDFDVALQHWGLYRFEVAPINGRLPSHPLKPVVSEFAGLSATVDGMMGALGGNAETAALLSGMMNSFAEVGELLKGMVAPPPEAK